MTFLVLPFPVKRSSRTNSRRDDSVDFTLTPERIKIPPAAYLGCHRAPLAELLL